MSNKPTTQPAAEPGKPTPKLDTMSIEEITAWASTATAKQLEAAIQYETNHKNRPDVLHPLKAAAQSAPPEEPEAEA